MEGRLETEGARIAGPVHSELAESAMRGGLRTHYEMAQLAAHLVRPGEGCIVDGPGASSEKSLAAGTE